MGVCHSIKPESCRVGFHGSGAKGTSAACAGMPGLTGKVRRWSMCVQEEVGGPRMAVNLQALSRDLRVKRRLPSLNPGRVQMRLMREVKLSFRPGGLVHGGTGTSADPNHRALIYKQSSVQITCQALAEVLHRLHAHRGGACKVPRRDCRADGRQLRNLNQTRDSMPVKK